MFFRPTPTSQEVVTAARGAAVGAAIVLVMMSGSARAEEGIRIPANLCSWQNLNWLDLNAAERLAWSGLGWSKQTWDDPDSAVYPASYRKSWPELVYTEKLLARKLGYGRRTWDSDGCPNYSTWATKDHDTAEQGRANSSTE